ncbi:TadE/TadG family type IV pilus assembly protein [Oceanobacillus saliphilus]|uniref:TadE/TadG family type IV pilus assembly protein n=1 Tax=Oceanobacillus saliphilus TaxID=2925834 RepID=UPI00201E3EA3|nr:TadE/TadG family type IV pilus assembly protein [Oceanobacillus saliphilus]
MILFYKKLNKNEDGNAIILMALAMSAMIAMVGVVIDGGNLFVSKSHLQKTANAAALSGAQEIVNSEAAVNEVVNQILLSHDEENSLSQVNIEANRQLIVELTKDVPLYFATLFGIDSVPITVDAKAGVNPMGEATGAVPLGINETVNLVYGQTYELKVDAGDSISGNFGVLALDGPGAKSYEETLTHGFDESLKVGDIVNTQTGNIAGPTRRGIDYRIANCPYPEGDYQERDCSRVMLVVVYTPHLMQNNQMKSVKITGFAYFYVNQQMSNTDDTVKGIFIKRTGPGVTGENSPRDRGAYAIKLEE